MGDYDWGQGLQGGAGGAMTGAAIGSVVPGIGTGLGAAIGGGLGLLGGFGGPSEQDEYKEMLKKLAQGYGERKAPQGTAVGAAGSQLTRNRAGLIAQLEAQARGQGPSAAALQMRDAMDRAAAAQASAAAGAGGRGVNVGAAYRNAANNTAALQSQAARDTGAIRAQEQLNATGQLGQVLGQGMATDNAMSQFNAGQQNQMTQMNMEATLRQLGLNDASQLQALMAALGKASPGLGTQLLAGGATAVPAIMSMRKPA